MHKMDSRIEIVSSTIAGLSSMGELSRNGLLTMLSKHYKHVRVTILNSLADLDDLVARKPDLVFLGMKYLPLHADLGRHDPEKIWITTFLDVHSIAYTGSGQVAHMTELDKSLAKRSVLKAGLKTAPFFVIRYGQTLGSRTLHFPLFVKPTDRGGGDGIDSASTVYNEQQLRSKLNALAQNLQSDALVERFLQGREFSVALLKEAYSDTLVAMPLELIAPIDEQGNRVLSAAVKSADTETFIPVTDPVIKEQISTLAIGAFKVIGGRDYGRIDIRMDDNNVPHFLEANLLPSLLEDYGNFPKACLLNCNLDYESAMLRIVQFGLDRGAVVRVRRTVRIPLVAPAPIRTLNVPVPALAPVLALVPTLANVPVLAASPTLTVAA